MDSLQYPYNSLNSGNETSDFRSFRQVFEENQARLQLEYRDYIERYERLQREIDRVESSKSRLPKMVFIFILT
jgi:N-dimethylarginine dimethylaminohydrolase